MSHTALSQAAVGEGGATDERRRPTADIHGRILVVDDYVLNRMQLKHGLEQQGHTVALAENGRQALETLDEGPFDLVLLDILMPEMDGYEVLARLKSDPARSRPAGDRHFRSG